MTDQLHNLSSQELGKLFPIILVDHNPEWYKLYDSEREQIIKTLGPDEIQQIEHIGSTAIPAIKSKPSIDILMEISRDAKDKRIIRGLSSIGYQYIKRDENPPPHMMFVKAYTVEGIKGQPYHIHIRYPGDWDEIHFRDYLLKYPAVAREYENLKLELGRKYRNDREAYTEGKTEFVMRINQLAREQ
jgi:GrpB-like predicted nucleotidyltransferase (UPF0157 family)